MKTDQIMRVAPIIPVMVIDSVAAAVPLAKALVEGGLPVLEITLRTDAAMDAMRAIIAEVPGAIVGAGTVLSARQLEDVTALGCRFAVSPGATDRLLDAANTIPCPLLPGASTASEVMWLLERGYDRQKFFPAEPSGGVPFLKSLGSPLPDALFCPTGGISISNSKDYLGLPNVLCVGGSWVAPAKAVAEGAWSEITRLAREAAQLNDNRGETA